MYFDMSIGLWRTPRPTGLWVSWQSHFPYGPGSKGMVKLPLVVWATVCQRVCKDYQLAASSSGMLQLENVLPQRPPVKTDRAPSPHTAIFNELNNPISGLREPHLIPALCTSPFFTVSLAPGRVPPAQAAWCTAGRTASRADNQSKWLPNGTLGPSIIWDLHIVYPQVSVCFPTSCKYLMIFEFRRMSLRYIIYL